MTTERVIHCIKCGIYVGTIRDAKLMKGLVFICKTCHEPTKEDNYDDMVDGIFGDVFKNSAFGDIFKTKKS